MKKKTCFQQKNVFDIFVNVSAEIEIRVFNKELAPRKVFKEFGYLTEKNPFLIFR